MTKTQQVRLARRPSGLTDDQTWSVVTEKKCVFGRWTDPLVSCGNPGAQNAGVEPEVGSARIHSRVGGVTEPLRRCILR